MLASGSMTKEKHQQESIPVSQRPFHRETEQTIDKSGKCLTEELDSVLLRPIQL